MAEEIKERNYGIELFRIVLIFMVCMLHTLGQGGVIKACEFGSLRFQGLWLLKIISYGAVNGFAMISGYTASTKPRKPARLVELWIQVFFYSFLITLFLTVIGQNPTMETKTLVRCAFPVTFKCYWYFTAFFVVFLAMPMINNFFFSLEKRTAQKAFVLMIVVFSVLGVINDPFKALNGYSTIWLLVLYCIGVLAKKIELFKNKGKLFLILVWLVGILVSWAGIVYRSWAFLYSYVSPFILISSMALLILFSRMKFKGTVIKRIAPLTFGIYLFQLSPVIWIKMKNLFAFAAKGSAWMVFGRVFLIAIGIFVSGMIVEFVRSKASKLFRIRTLSEKIVGVIGKVLGGLTAFFR